DCNQYDYSVCTAVDFKSVSFVEAYGIHNDTDCRILCNMQCTDLAAGIYNTGCIPGSRRCKDVYGYFCGSMWIFRIIFSYILGQYFGMGVFGVWVAMIIDWVARSVCFLLRFKSGK